jgi:WD40 repeat protein
MSIEKCVFIGMMGYFVLLLSTPTPEPNAIPKSVYQIAVSGDGRVLAVTYHSYPYRSIIDFFDSASGQLLHTVDVAPLAANHLALSPTGDRLFFTSGGGSELSIYYSQTGITETLSRWTAVSIKRIGWNPANNEIAYALGGGVQIADAGTSEWLYAIGAGPGLVVDLSWTSDGSRLATSSYHESSRVLDSREIKSIKVWDLSTSEKSLTVPMFGLEDQGGGSVALSPDGKRLAFIDDNQLMIYDVNSGQLEADLPVDTKELVQVVWNLTGDRLATGGSELRIWDTSSWEVEKEIKLDGTITQLQWSLDGEHVFNDGGVDGLYLDDKPVSELESSSNSVP